MRSGVPSAKTRRAPASTFRDPPALRPAPQARTTPARLLRSAIPRASRPRAAAVATSSSGCEAARRKEKLLAAASSA